MLVIKTEFIDLGQVMQAGGRYTLKLDAWRVVIHVTQGSGLGTPQIDIGGLQTSNVSWSGTVMRITLGGCIVHGVPVLLDDEIVIAGAVPPDGAVWVIKEYIVQAPGDADAAYKRDEHANRPANRGQVHARAGAAGTRVPGRAAGNIDQRQR